MTRRNAVKSAVAPPKRAEAPEEEVPSGTSKEILGWVAGDKNRAQAALNKEQSGDQPRKGLVRELNELVAEGDDGNDESTSDGAS